MSCDTP
jgi:hypothetical protein